MPQHIDTTSLTDLITEFRKLTAKDAITPESLGAVLQRITDLKTTPNSMMSFTGLVHNRPRQANTPT